MILIIWEYCLTGQEISTKLICIKKQAEKVTKAMFEVLKRGRTHNLSIECQLELFNKMVKPILLYGSEIWSFQFLEKVQLSFCTLLLKLKTLTPSYYDR